MGIRINVNARQDYSYLFQGLSTSSGGGMGNLNFLSDYAAIKNGSYGKLMKAYYAETGSKNSTSSASKVQREEKQSISTAADSAKKLANIEKSAEALKESADELLTTGSKSVFRKENVTTKDEAGFETTTKEFNVDKIYKAVSGFVEDYNNMLKEAGESNTRSVLNKAVSLVNMTEANEKLLSDVGITIGEDNKLSINEETFKKADMNTVKTLFNGNSSYAYRVSAQASMIDYAAARESSKANTYTGAGTYSNVYSSGNLIDALF